MSLSKKHFLKIAEILNRRLFEVRANKEFDTITLHRIKIQIFYLTDELSDYFATENPLFDRERFKQAILKGAE